MKTIKLANVVVQIHVRDEYSGQRVLYCPSSIIVMVNALIKIVMAVIAVALY